MADLSKIKLSGTTYNLKDAAVRANLETLLGEHALAALHAAAWQDVDSAVAAGAEGLPTTAAVKSYVDAQVGAIHNFDVRIFQADSEGKPSTAASEQTMYILALVADQHAASGSYIEWITIRNGEPSAYTYAWEKIGSTQTDLGDYLQKTATVAGIAFGADSAISVAELEAAEALDLKALAHKANATGTVPGQTISNLKASGSVDLELEGALAYDSTAASLTKGNYTPAGSVTIAADSSDGTQISGSVSKPDIDVTPAEDTFVKSLKAGTVDAASYSHTGFDGGSLGNATKSAFATEGLVGEVGTGDDAETLILTAAGTSQAVTEQGTFTAATYGTDTFTAEKLPVVDGTAKALTGVSAELHNAPVFTGDKFGATFAGTEAQQILVTAVNYDKANIGTVDVKSANVELDVDNVVVADQNVTVS